MQARYPLGAVSYGTCYPARDPVQPTQGGNFFCATPAWSYVRGRARQAVAVAVDKLEKSGSDHNPVIRSFPSPKHAETLVLFVLCTHFMVSLVAPLLFSKWGRSAFYVLAAVPAASFVWLIAQHPRVYSPDLPTPSLDIPWIPAFELNLSFRLDELAWLMSLLILGVGALVLAYCARYFKSDDAGLGGFGAQLLAFAGVMFGLVTADNLILLFVFWELTTILSFLLIGYARKRIAARRAALQALIVTTFGGLAMLVGLIMVGEAAGTYSISGVVAMAPELMAAGGSARMVVDIGVFLLLVGAVSKSALLPFHFWLPGAMAAPTPVSAYLHAAAMVKAGIYLVARLAPGFSDTQYWQLTIVVLGLVL